MLSSRACLAGLCVLLACTPAFAANITEADVLNFALNLEYLEANFYKCARDGKPLSSELRGGGPAPIGCKKAQGLDAESLYLLRQIAADEIAHVRFLRKALGDAAVPQPLIDIGPAFVAAANAAAGTTLDKKFSPYRSAVEFLHGAFIFEDVGVTAYHGGLRALTTDAFRDAAEGILAVEAYHAGAVRLALRNKRWLKTGYADTTVQQLIGLISKLRDSADCSDATEDAGLELLAPADKSGIAYSRSVEGVLKIVYLGGVNKGGFFPKGVNGVIRRACA
ncbi:hypothetical protein D9Q98_004885 [Chlorella vulgaris]|uniref:Desiccation-related protein PCC13-62 n=1 Tax=Chlorella vulgaris TaxID=3077 RepID=A0A9D4YX48_CHLVU|nr:hypothetical protein D9Q98_004885 [Chlorella vulgaris]